MQPYFLPYIGYFQLIQSVDEFIIYDNVQYTKKGWINRNRILVEGTDKMFTIPLKKDSDFLNVYEREISSDWNKDKLKIINQIKTYSKAPYFKEVFQLIEKIFNNNISNLFEFIFNSLTIINEYLEIKTKIVISSTIDIDHNLKSQDKVIAICKKRNATQYINAIGGVELYDKIDFQNNNIKLNFIKSDPIIYRQFKNEFIPWLSIIDVMMFNSKEEISKYLKSYTLI